MNDTALARAIQERPILFRRDMIEAIGAGRKTQTRRVAKDPQGKCPYGEPGDRLWIKSGRHGRRVDSPGVLQIVATRLEPLCDIEHHDAVREGCTSVDTFLPLWNRINARRGYGWERNPPVWVITFRVLECKG